MKERFLREESLVDATTDTLLDYSIAVCPSSPYDVFTLPDNETDAETDKK